MSVLQVSFLSENSLDVYGCTYCDIRKETKTKKTWLIKEKTLSSQENIDLSFKT